MQQNGQPGPTPATDYALYRDIEAKMLTDELDPETLESWHQVSEEIMAEIQGYHLTETRIAADLESGLIGPNGQAQQLAKERQAYADRLGALERQVLEPITKEIERLEKVFTPPSPSSGDVVLHYLRQNEIRAQLSRLSAAELQVVYMTALDEDDDEVMEAIEGWPGKSLTKSVPGMIMLPQEQTASGKRQRMEKKFPEQTAQLARLMRLRISYESLLREARFRMGLSVIDHTLERLSR
jgi:hypothetical protein